MRTVQSSGVVERL